MEIAETRNSGLGISLPEPAGTAVNLWRRLYDPNYESLWPHITLAYPPFVPPEEWPRVKPAIAACLADFQPFKVTLRETGIFLGNPNHVLWLKPEDGGVLVRIRHALEKALPEHVPPLPFEYQPHVSLCFFQGIEALRQAQEKVQNELTPVVFQVSHVGYAFQQADDLWRTYDLIPLGGGISQVDESTKPGWERDQ